VTELASALTYIATPMFLYSVSWFVYNFVRAIIRVPIYRQREVVRLANEIIQRTSPQLRLEFPEAELNFSSTETVTFVKVRNLTTLTIENVSVRVASIEKIDGPEDPSKLPQPLQNYVGLPLSIRDAGAPSSYGYAPYEVTIHTEDSVSFNVLLMQSPYLTLLHAKQTEIPALTSLREPNQTIWIQSPEANLPPGHYRIQLKAQGRNTPPARLTIEFMQSDSKRTVQQVEEVVPRETNSTIS
jgi:hypothetical protein